MKVLGLAKNSVCAERLNLFWNKDLSFNGVVVDLTSRCNARCRVCLADAGPTGHTRLGKQWLPIERVEIVAAGGASLISRGLLSRRSFHIVGGEPFLDVRRVLETLDVARKYGYPLLTTVTNGFWGKRIDVARRICAQLAAHGLLVLGVSWDCWHAEYVSAECISNVMIACHEYDIMVSLRLLSCREHSECNMLDSICEDALAGAYSISSNVPSLTGRAAREIRSSEVVRQDSVHGCCSDCLALYVDPAGFVYPCCSTLTECEFGSFGNTSNCSLASIGESMNKSVVLRVLAFLGPAILAKLLRGMGYIVSGADKCELCWRIFSSRDMTSALYRVLGS